MPRGREKRYSTSPKKKVAATTQPAIADTAAPPVIAATTLIYQHPLDRIMTMTILQRVNQIKKGKKK